MPDIEFYHAAYGRLIVASQKVAMMVWSIQDFIDEAAHGRTLSKEERVGRTFRFREEQHPEQGTVWFVTVKKDEMETEFPIPENLLTSFYSMMQLYFLLAGDILKDCDGMMARRDELLVHARSIMPSGEDSPLLSPAENALPYSEKIGLILPRLASADIELVVILHPVIFSRLWFGVLRIPYDTRRTILHHGKQVDPYGVVADMLVSFIVPTT